MASSPITAKFERREVIAARFNALLPGVQEKLAKVTIEGAESIAQTAKNFAPYRSGKYKRSLQAARLADMPGKGRRSPVASQTKDPNAAGVYANYIWRFLEFGTVKMAAQPHIMPAYRIKKKAIRRRMVSAVSRAVRRLEKGGGG